jgi:hypothetical protein
MIHELSHELVYVTDVNRISNGANMKMYSSIRIDFQYFVRPTKG